MSHVDTPHPVLPSPQALRSSRRHPRRSGHLPRTIRLPGEPGRVRSARGRVARQRPTAPGPGGRLGPLRQRAVLSVPGHGRRVLPQERRADGGAGEHPAGDPDPPQAVRSHAGPGVRPAGAQDGPAGDDRLRPLPDGESTDESADRVRMFKWAVSRGDGPSLRPSRACRRSRGSAGAGPTSRESEPVRPVPDAFVDAVEPHVSRQVWAMIELQRSRECGRERWFHLRTIDIDTSGRVWTYTPGGHKTEHHGRERRIYLRPEGPRDPPAVAPGRADGLPVPPGRRRPSGGPRQRAARKPGPTLPAEPGQASTRRSPASRTPSRATAGRSSTGLQTGRGAEPGLPTGSATIAATRLRREFGLDVARAVLGHCSPVVTEVYAEMDGAKAAEAMERVG